MRIPTKVLILCDNSSTQSSVSHSSSCVALRCPLITCGLDKANPLKTAQLKDAAKKNAAGNSSAKSTVGGGGKSTVGIPEEPENSLEAVSLLTETMILFPTSTSSSF